MLAFVIVREETRPTHYVLMLTEVRRWRPRCRLHQQFRAAGSSETRPSPEARLRCAKMPSHFVQIGSGHASPVQVQLIRRLIQVSKATGEAGVRRAGVTTSHEPSLKPPAHANQFKHTVRLQVRISDRLLEYQRSHPHNASQVENEDELSKNAAILGARHYPCTTCQVCRSHKVHSRGSVGEAREVRRRNNFGVASRAPHTPEFPRVRNTTLDGLADHSWALKDQTGHFPASVASIMHDNRAQAPVASLDKLIGNA